MKDDTLSYVEYTETNTALQPVYYINGIMTNVSVFDVIDPHIVDSIIVKNNKININNKAYDRQIFIKMKKEYHPKTKNI
jgi:hypothetical protein